MRTALSVAGFPRVISNMVVVPPLLPGLVPNVVVVPPLLPGPAPNVVVVPPLLLGPAPNVVVVPPLFLGPVPNVVKVPTLFLEKQRGHHHRLLAGLAGAGWPGPSPPCPRARPARPGRLHNQSSDCIIILNFSQPARPAQGSDGSEGRMGARVAVAGASGYAGGELLRLLAGHPEFELGPVTAQSSVGRPIADVHPHLAGLLSLAGRSFDAADLLQDAGCDLVFLALPAGESAPLAAGLDPGVALVDLGPDFRLADPHAWARHYRSPHAGRWTTGLPELPGARKRIRAAKRVAVPGCYATAAIVALAPLLAARVIEPHDIVIVAASGTSGAGRSLRADLLASEVMGAVSAYQAAGTHRHTPEIEQALGETAGQHGITVSFTPILAPVPRGILATCTARLAGGAATAELTQTLARAYAGEPFVCLLPGGRWPTTAAVTGSNGVHLQAAADPRTGRATVVAAIDNLGKGAAGQAIQDANLMLGLAETVGLTTIGVAP
jgi:N-acetyl-gamma-glutamyl-phosphate reductase